jgi:hypothetical protein
MSHELGIPPKPNFQELIAASHELGDKPRYHPGGAKPGEGILESMHFLGNIQLPSGGVGDAYIKKGAYHGHEEDGIGVWRSDEESDYAFQVEHGFTNIAQYGYFVNDQVVVHSEDGPKTETYALPTNTGLKLAIAKGIVSEYKLVRHINPLQPENRFDLEDELVDPDLIERIAKIQGFSDASVWEEAWRAANLYVKDAQPHTYAEGEQPWWYDLPDLTFVHDLVRSRAENMPLNAAAMQRLVVRPISHNIASSDGSTQNT